MPRSSALLGLLCVSLRSQRLRVKSLSFLRFLFLPNHINLAIERIPKLIVHFRLKNRK
jgi:hypothetical protein